MLNTQDHSPDATLAETAPAPGPAPRKRRLEYLLAGVALLATAVLIGPRLVDHFRPHLYAGTVLQGSNPAPPLDGLVTADGAPADLTGFDGDLVLVFFGYANCPDVCPGTLATAALAIEQLGDAGDNIDLVMVGVDPERDTPEDLEAYVDLFDPRFQSVSGSEADTANVASLYGVYYAISQDAASDPGSEYLIDHTATLMGVDRAGDLRIVWPPDVDFAVLAEDIRALTS